MKVLIAENNRMHMRQLRDLLDKDGYQTVSASTGTTALDVYKNEAPDFICLDIMMPDMSGYDVCRIIRQTDSITPIIFISAKSAAVDKVAGFAFGADDYITKPFDIDEVKARIKAVARRCMALMAPERHRDSFQFGDLTVFPNRLTAERGDETIELGLRDIKLLKLFQEHRNDVMDRNQLLDACWGAHIMPESRTVDWHISQLRKKIERDPKNPRLIKTVHAAGYKFDDMA